MLMTLMMASTVAGTVLELPPKVYAQARADATSVIVITDVRTRGIGFQPRGDCRVRGRVSAVERGADFTVGQRVTLAVPCISFFYNSPQGPWPGVQQDQLSRSRSGRVFLTDGELVLRGYDILEP